MCSSTQYGSKIGKVDYITETHTAIATINYLVSEAFKVFLTAAYNQSKAGMEEIELGGPTADDVILNGTNGFTRNYEYDLSEVNDYSDIEMKSLDLTVGASYKIGAHFALSAEYTYLYYNEAEYYLYDGSGDVQFGSLSFSYIF